MTIEPGPATVAVLLFLLLAGWCFTHRRVDRSLAVLGLYLGLLDGYLKLRTGSPLTTLGRDVLIAAIAGGALLRTLMAHKPLPLPPLGGLVLAFSAIVFLEMFNPAAPNLRAGVAGLRQHLEFVPLFFLGYAVMRTPRHLKVFAVILVLCAAAGGVVSYIQSTLTPEQLADWGPGYRERVFGTGTFTGAGRVAFNDDGSIAVRPFGLGSDNGAGALAAALALPALVAMMLWSEGRLRYLTIPLAVGIALAVATSGSRAGLVIVFVSATAFAVLAVASRNALRVVMGVALGAVFVFAAFELLGPETSTSKRARTVAPGKVLTTYRVERGSSAAKVADYAVRYPLGLGVGSVGPAGVLFGARERVEPLSTETLWNFLVLEVGLAGLAVFLALLVSVLLLAITRIRRVPDQTLRLNLAAIAAPIFGLTAASFAGPTTLGVPAGPYLWFAAGVLSYWLVTAVAAPRFSIGERVLNPETPSGGSESTAEPRVGVVRG